MVVPSQALPPQKGSGGREEKGSRAEGRRRSTKARLNGSGQRPSAAGAEEASERREVSVRGVVRGIYTPVAVTGLKWTPGPVNL